ncbi:hypothetical protein CEXT_414871, partial [Caerostris extrusa]
DLIPHESALKSVSEPSHPPDDDQEKFPMEVSNASANLWPKRVLNSTEANNPIPPGRKMSQETSKRIPYTIGRPLQPKLHPLKLCLGKCPVISCP